jgi:hypothetical protein
MMAETAEAPVEEPTEAPLPTEAPMSTEAPMWETAECTCPDWCERDHEQD